MKPSANSLFWPLSCAACTLLALALPAALPLWGVFAALAAAALLIAVGLAAARPRPRVETEPPREPPKPEEEAAAPEALSTPRDEKPDPTPVLGTLHYVSQQLHDASVAHIREILAPLSASLFGVKANLQGLLRKSGELETSFRNDSHGMGETVSRFATQSQDIRRYAQDLDASVKKFSDTGTEMEKRLGAITEASRQINDVAERIKVLSINASIEAARAGKQGAGFKIISQEVRRLAEDTNLFATRIDQTIASAIGETKDSFDQFTRQSFLRAEEMHVILKTTEDLEGFVKGLFSMIDGIFREYDGFVTQLESELDNISPTLQRNEIATQQIENTWRGLRENLRAVFPGLEPDRIGVPAAELRTLLETFARHLTTPLEAEVLRRIGGDSGVAEVVARASGSDITLF